jgi:outer membrane receptor protein involved in Fe transport
VSYDFKLWNADRTEAFLTVNNVLDRTPPFAGTGFQGTGGTNTIFYDALGRMFRMGVRMKF